MGVQARPQNAEEKRWTERWCSQWGYADSQGFGVSRATGLIEFVNWDEADKSLQRHVDRFARQEQADHDAIHVDMKGSTPEAVELLERRISQQRPPGEEFAVVVESVTGHRYAFTIEYDGPGE